MLCTIFRLSLDITMCVFDMQFERGVCVLRGISYRCVWPASGIK